MAVPDSLQKLLEDGVIDDIKTRLMSGKEATVYVVERQGELIAAKIYKSREQRTFKATASYTEGRNQTRNTRDKRAMGKRTTYGKELVEKNWRDMEFQALTDAWNAGVRVPEPILLYDDVLLMQLLVDELGNPAPRLADFELPADVAELIHREIYGQVRLLLASGKVHGDLSAFNILVAEGGPTIIDMPQVVDASGNQSAAEILRRDLANVTEHLAKFDARLLRFRDCGIPLWRHYERGSLDTALDPEEGIIRGDAHRSRRVRDAERGRMGRDPGRPAVKAPIVDEPRRGSPQQQHQQQAQQHDTQARAEQRPQRSFIDEPRRGPPPQQERRPFSDDQRRGPPPPQQQERRPFNDDQRPRGPLYQQQQQQRPPLNDDQQPRAQQQQQQGFNGQQDRRPFNDDQRPRTQQQQGINGQQDRRANDDRFAPPQQQQGVNGQDRRPFNDDRRPDDRRPPQHQQGGLNGQQDRRPFNDDQRRGPPPQQQQQQERRPFSDDQRRGPPPQQQQQQDRRPFTDDQRRGPPPRQQQQQQRPFADDRRPFSDDQRRVPQPPQQHRPFDDDQDRRGPGPRSQQPFADDRGPPPQQQDRRPFNQRRPPPAIERLPARRDPGGGSEPGT